MSFQSTAILDPFNTGASQTLPTRTGWAPGHWTGTLDLKTDATPTKATTSLGTPASNIWAANYTTDHEVMFTFGTTIATVQLLGRVNSTSVPSAGYVGYVSSGNQEIQTRAGASIAVGSAIVPIAGDSFRLRCVGSIISLDYRPFGGVWVNILTVVDTTYTTGTFIGIHVAAGAPDIDEFGGGISALASVLPILWQADHETGDYSEWDIGTFGGRQDNGTASSAISSTRAHTGTYSLKMTTDATLGNTGARNFRWALDYAGTDLPVTARYTAWYYFDQVYAPVNFWNIMQWKTKRDNLGSNDPDWSVNVYNTAGSMRLYMFDHHTGSNWSSFSPVGSLPANAWNKIEVDYKWVETGGAITCYLNGVQWFAITGVVTRWPSTETQRFRHWSINNYTDANSPQISNIWADDVSISTTTAFSSTGQMNLLGVGT